MMLTHWFGGHHRQPPDRRRLDRIMPFALLRLARNNKTFP